MPSATQAPRRTKRMMIWGLNSGMVVVGVLYRGEAVGSEAFGEARRAGWES